MDAALAPAVAARLRAQERPLYALVDAARDERVLELLSASDEERQSLYEGPKGEVLAPYAPWLVSLPPGSPLLEALIREGWGKSWGVYLTSGARFRDVRRHLRRFLMVKTERGKKLYFRFYDPRILRVFLPVCTPRQASMMFGEVDAFLVEARDPRTLLVFRAGAGDVSHAAIAVQDAS